VPGRRPEDRIGTTFAGVVVCGGELCIAGMGDSRVYLLRRSRRKLAQIKQDDTVLGDALARGVPHAIAASLPKAHALTRMLGALPGVAALPVIHPWEPDDMVLLCTDGVSDRLDVDTIADILLGAVDPDMAAQRLVRRAVEAGSPDNVTALVLHRTA
jgi:protein phosphatase